ncbi:protein-tyrosine-phosphatase [uncultured Maribacter sp.]|uniref:protein-tyrosine-phosphatase n=1 Tax=uncultured Maribacter sp. TaxID=431308 RepID=UPI002606E07E|nr:protein-tyrosine-phosphatase [uncultured Maribacter sp.]
MLYPEITKQIEALDSSTISEERKNILTPLITFIQNKKNNKDDIRLNFICTHNSRRSHLSQVWAQTLASHFNIKNVFSYSGGTEATALFPMAAKALENSGFRINTISNENNPVYNIKNSQNNHPIIGFSKTYDDNFNPSSEFAAILTCSSADKGCPFIAGAEKRIPITFEDPKAFDNTPEQEEKYLERSIQIATELHYVFSEVK